jgi:hypothetical protein
MSDFWVGVALDRARAEWINFGMPRKPQPKVLADNGPRPRYQSAPSHTTDDTLTGVEGELIWCDDEIGRLWSTIRSALDALEAGETYEAAGVLQTALDKKAAHG